MLDVGIVIGGIVDARPLVVGKNKVYVHTDIKPLEQDGVVVEGMYSYNEVQYDKNEYIELMATKNEKLSNELTDTQLALCEVYELMI